MKAYVPGARVEAGRGSSGHKAGQAAGLTFSLIKEKGAEQAGTLSSAWSQLPSQSLAVSSSFGGSVVRPGPWPEWEHLLRDRDHTMHVSVPPLCRHPGANGETSSDEEQRGPNQLPQPSHSTSFLILSFPHFLL